MLVCVYLCADMCFFCVYIYGVGGCVCNCICLTGCVCGSVDMCLCVYRMGVCLCVLICVMCVSVSVDVCVYMWVDVCVRMCVVCVRKCMSVFIYDLSAFLFMMAGSNKCLILCCICRGYINLAFPQSQNTWLFQAPGFTSIQSDNQSPIQFTSDPSRSDAPRHLWSRLYIFHTFTLDVSPLVGIPPSPQTPYKFSHHSSPA